MINKLKIPTVLVVLLVAFVSNAQSDTTTSEKLHVHNQSNGDGMALHQNRIFGKDQGILSTARDKGETQILFSNASGWEGASNLSYVDGFVKSDHDNAFIFPIGGGGQFKPMACSKPKGVSAAYFVNDSSFDVEQSAEGVAMLNKSAYWVVQGASPTQLTFCWNENDNVKAFSNSDLSKLKILGFNGSKWKVIESRLEPFVLDTKNSNKNYLETSIDFAQGAISTFDEIVPNLYMAYAIGVSDSYETPESTVVAAKVVSENSTSAINNTSAIADTNASSTDNLDLSSYRKVRSIHFPFNESKITQYSTILLHRLSKKLKGTNPIIRLVGHADFYGSQDYNYELGLDRANAVKDMLADFGIDTVQVDILSNGEYVLESGCDNCSTKETIIDRRVDVYVFD